MSNRNKFIDTLRRNGVKFKEVMTESGMAIKLPSRDKGSKSFDVYAFIEESQCHLEIHSKTPVDLSKIQDIQTFINSRLQFKSNTIRWDINSLGIYRVESTLPNNIVGELFEIEFMVSVMHIVMNSHSSFIEAIASGAKSVNQVIADFDLYAVKIIP